MHNFKNLLFWQKSIALAKEVYLICQEISKDEKFGLVSQMKRASISIPSNIAEGSGRNSNKEFNYFLGIALGSAFELQTQIILSNELELLSNDKLESVLKKLEEIQKMIFTFKEKFKNNK